jgi:hypothetical protein
MWAMVILMLLTLGGGAAFLKWGRVTKQPGLGLETYDINGAFLIRWDRESTTILGASHATLEIEDGAEKTPIELTPTELSAGGYGYLRRTPQVSVRMKVDGPSPVEEYSNFKGIQVTSSPPPQTQTPIPDQADAPEPSKALAKALEDKDHLKTELLNESMVSSDLRREITSLRKQLAEARAKPPAR